MKKPTILLTITLALSFNLTSHAQSVADIFKAIEENNLEKVKTLIASDVDVTERRGGGGTAGDDTPLMVASMKGNAEIVKALLAAEAPVNAKTQNGTTALIMAAMWKKAEIAKLLIDAGANVNAKLNNGRTALVVAAKQNDLEMVKLLLAAKADINAENGKTLVEFVIRNNVEMATALLAAGADVNAKDNEYQKGTPLLIAVENKNPNMIKILLDAGADVNVKNGTTTALMLATKQQSLKIVKTLIAAGADVNARGYDGTTALIEAAEMGDVDIVNALIDAKADVNAQRDDKGMTALMLSARGNHVDVVEALLAAGADVKIKTKVPFQSDLTVINFAKGKKDILALIEAATPVKNTNDKDGMTELTKAVTAGKLEQVKINIAPLTLPRGKQIFKELNIPKEETMPKNFTLDLSIKIKDLEGARRPFIREQGKFSLAINSRNVNGRWYHGLRFTFGHISVDSTVDLTVDTLYHIIAEYSGDDKEIRIYMDDKLVGTKSCDTPPEFNEEIFLIVDGVFEATYEFIRVGFQ